MINWKCVRATLKFDIEKEKARDENFQVCVAKEQKKETDESLPFGSRGGLGAFGFLILAGVDATVAGSRAAVVVPVFEGSVALWLLPFVSFVS